MLTFAQRQKFFAAAHAAYLAVRPAAPFDEWRQNEMELIGLPASTKQMDHVWHFERAMLHFAILSDDAGAMSYWGGCARRRLEWIFGGFLKDLAFLQEREPSADTAAYIDGLMSQSKIEEIDAENLRKLCAMVDTRIRQLAKSAGVELSALPTAGRPWCFRGSKAAAMSAFIGTRRAA